jgi:hypothetical protein
MDCTAQSTLIMCLFQFVVVWRVGGGEEKGGGGVPKIRETKRKIINKIK